jgi:hypothetical protein
MPGNVMRRLVGACVPVAVQRTTTRSPSATRSSAVKCRSGNSARIAGTRRDRSSARRDRAAGRSAQGSHRRGRDSRSRTRRATAGQGPCSLRPWSYLPGSDRDGILPARHAGPVLGRGSGGPPPFSNRREGSSIVAAPDQTERDAACCAVRGALSAVGAMCEPPWRTVPCGHPSVHRPDSTSGAVIDLAIRTAVAFHLLPTTLYGAGAAQPPRSIARIRPCTKRCDGGPATWRRRRQACLRWR